MERIIDHRCPLKIIYLHLRKIQENDSRIIGLHLVVVTGSPLPWAGIVLSSECGRHG